MKFVIIDHLGLHRAGEPSYCGCLGTLGWMMWMLGYPEQAMHRMTQASELADRVGGASDRAAALNAELLLRSHFLREYSGVRAKAQALVAMSQESGIRFLRALGMVRLGRIEVATGNVNEGIRLMLEGIALNQSRRGWDELPVFSLPARRCVPGRGNRAARPRGNRERDCPSPRPVGSDSTWRNSSG